jgi:hypothetical protein
MLDMDRLAWGLFLALRGRLRQASHIAAAVGGRAPNRWRSVLLSIFHSYPIFLDCPMTSDSTAQKYERFTFVNPYQEYAT